MEFVSDHGHGYVESINARFRITFWVTACRPRKQSSRQAGHPAAIFSLQLIRRWGRLQASSALILYEWTDRSGLIVAPTFQSDKMDNDFLVTVCRHPGDWHAAEYRMSDIHSLRWSQITGGVKRRTPYPMVMGYVRCDGMVSGELAHSCDHGPPPHSVKVCLIRKYNQPHWGKILEFVGPKPNGASTS